jgi:serine O-acetyltransferase
MNSAHLPPEDDPQHLVCETTAELLPLYGQHEEDAPDNVLANCPEPEPVVEGLRMLIDLLLPGRLSNCSGLAPDEIGIFLMRRLSQVWRLLRPQVERALPYRWRGQAARSEGAPPPEDLRQGSHRVLTALYGRLPDLRRLIIEDIKAAYEGDPAALTYAEVQLAYPGLLAVASHRLAHEFYVQDVPILPRIMSEWTHAQTGVDIHPGAKVGHGFFIDHATGVVIGETCEIGNGVKIYQGVTLGARSFPLDAGGNPIKHIKRHPTVEDEVVIYAHATILGGETVIGRGSQIGANVFLMESVPAGSTVSASHPDLRIKARRDRT